MLKIRHASARDLALIEQWACYSAWESLSPQEQQAADPVYITDQVGQLLSSLRAYPHASLVLLAEAGGWPAGFLLAGVQPDTTTGEPQGYFYDVFVVPALRRHGIGGALQRAAEQIFASAGLRKVKMWSGIHNTAALRLAERSGFQPEGLIGLKEW